MKKNLLPILAILFSVTIWGLSFLSIKIVVQEIPPASMAWFRQIPSILTLLFLLHRRGIKYRLPKKDWLMFVAASLFGLILYSTFENSSLQYLSPSSASMLVSSIPVFVLLIDSIKSRKRPDGFTAFVIALSIGGVWLVLYDGGVSDFLSGRFLGNLLMLAAMASWIVYTFISQKLGQRYSSLELITGQTLISIGLFLPFTIGEMHRWQMPSMTSMLHLIFLGIFSSAIAFVFYLYGVNQLGSVVPSAFLNLCPVVTIIAGLLIFGDVPSGVQIWGAVLIVGSLSALSIVKMFQARRLQALGPNTEIDEPCPDYAEAQGD
ncbi:MAG: DMT family transporter [Eubacteriales bacterium]|nr:DMT family transporter [Eubacteriales bacterium]